METSASVLLAGISAFSAFVGPPMEAVGRDRHRVRISQAYAAGATLVVGYLLAVKSGTSLPMTMSLFVIAMEMLAFEHASRGGIVNA